MNVCVRERDRENEGGKIDKKTIWKIKQFSYALQYLMLLASIF